MKLFSQDVFDGMEFVEPTPIPSGKRGGGGSHDGLLWDIICKLLAFFDVIGERIVCITGIVEGEEYTALTGQTGQRGVQIATDKEKIGILGCPSLGKIMAHLELNTEEDIRVRKDNGLSDIWNSVDSPCETRKELARQITRYTKEFKAKGDPFLKFANMDESATLVSSEEDSVEETDSENV